jgi:hypothetical protein
LRAVSHRVAGTPAGSPVAPALPANSITLATIAVGAGATAITNANITDTRVLVTTNIPESGDISAVNAGTGSGYSFQQSNANGIRLGAGYYTTTVFYIMCQATPSNITETRAGFQDVFTAALPVDGLYWNISLNSTTTYNATLVARNNSVQTLGTTYGLNCNNWYTVNIYVNSSTLATGQIYNDSMTLLNTQTVNANIPTTTLRETSSGVVSYVKGIRYTAQGLGLIALDYFEIGVNNTMVR